VKEDVKQAWVAALRSGEYEQAQHQLHTSHGYCCLGVLCDISGLGEWDGCEYIIRIGTDLTEAADTELPQKVAEWAGLKPGNGAVVTIDGQSAGLPRHNDGDEDEDDPCRPRSFAEIADAIEAQL
jgi:hypothetical protein